MIIMDAKKLKPWNYMNYEVNICKYHLYVIITFYKDFSIYLGIAIFRNMFPSTDQYQQTIYFIESLHGPWPRRQLPSGQWTTTDTVATCIPSSNQTLQWKIPELDGGFSGNNILT